MPSSPVRRRGALALTALAAAAGLGLSGCSLLWGTSEPAAPVVEGNTYDAPFAWADGSPVRAAVVHGEDTPRRGISSLAQYRAGEVPGDESNALGVLSDGRLVDLDGGNVKLLGPNGSSTEWLPQGSPEVWQYSLVGDRLFGSIGNADNSKLYAFGEPGQPAEAPVSIPNASGDASLAHDGALYWSEADTGKGGASRVMTAAPGADPRVAREGAFAPMACGDGNKQVCVVVGQRPSDVSQASAFKSLQTLEGKTIVSVRGSLPATNDVDLQVDGNIVTAANLGPAGVLVMNTKTKKAWMVTSPGVVRAGVPRLSDGRVAWSFAPSDGSGVGKEAWTFDASRGALSVLTLPDDPQSVLGLNKGWLAVGSTGSHSSSSLPYEVAKLD